MLQKGIISPEQASMKIIVRDIQKRPAPALPDINQTTGSQPGSSTVDNDPDLRPAPWHPRKLRKSKSSQKETENSKNVPYKGYGKWGSLGIQVANYTGGKTAWVTPPKPVPNTREAIQAMFDDNYYSLPGVPFWNGKDLADVDTGSHVLWKSVPTGKNGGESTRVEYFHGIIHGWYDPETVVIS